MRCHVFDLEKQRLYHEMIPKKVHEAFIGGRSLAAWWAFEHIPARIPSLSKHNQIIFSTGPLTGNDFIIGANRTTCVFQSPLTGTMFSSSVGGRFGKYLKHWNIDMLVLTGELQEDPKARSQQFLILENGVFRIESFPQLHDADIHEARTFLQQELFSTDHLVVLTGPAAQKGLYFANVSTEPHHYFGRGGLGAVMMSKRLRGLIIAPRNYSSMEHQHNEANMDDVQVIQQFNSLISSSSFYQNVSTKGTLSFLSSLLRKNMLTKKHLTERLNISNLNEEEKGFLTRLGVDLTSFSQQQWQQDMNHALDNTSNNPDDLNLNVLNDELEQASFDMKEKSSDENEHLTRPEPKDDPLENTNATSGDLDHSLSKIMPWLCLGPTLNQFDIDTVRHSISLCNSSGVDVMSIAGGLGNLAYLAERGHLPGMDLFRWNKRKLNDFIAEVVKKKSPLGGWMETGEAYMLEQKGVNNGTCIKRMFIGPFNPRESTGFYLGALLSPRGGCHLRGGMAWLNEALELVPERKKSRKSIITEITSRQIIYLTVLDTLGLDYFILFAWLDVHENKSKSFSRTFLHSLLRAIRAKVAKDDSYGLLCQLSTILNSLGKKEHQWKPHDLWNVGLRGFLTEKLYNLRNGIKDTENGLSHDDDRNASERKYQELLLKCYKMLYMDESELPQLKAVKALRLDRLLTQF